MRRAWPGAAVVTMAVGMTAALGLPGAAMALCDVTYRVQPGDTLSGVALRHYGDASLAGLIEGANAERLGGAGPVAGGELYIPCPEAEAPPGPAEAEAPDPDPDPLAGGLSAEGPLRLLTGGGYVPFADPAWPEGGLAVELVREALALSLAPVQVELGWEADRSLHLFPLLDEKRRDMGFPFVRPDCAADPDEPLCARFHFSAPLMELPVMLFLRAGETEIAGEADLEGRRLCRPEGFATHDLDREGRRWLSEGKLELIQPGTAEACFAALVAGEVDAVSVDVFLGASRIVAMGLRGKVLPLDEPLSRESLHVVISKSHPRGTAHLYRLNAGLEALRESGRYAEIVGRHLEIFWERLK